MGWAENVCSVLCYMLRYPLRMIGIGKGWKEKGCPDGAASICYEKEVVCLIKNTDNVHPSR